MKSKFQKCMALFLALIITIFSAPFSNAVMAAPRVAVQISMLTDADASNEVKANTDITATVTWKSMFATTGEPITIQATNGAEILISNESDVIFNANGIPASIGSVTRSPDGSSVTFMSGPPATTPLDNDITFHIKAPAQVGDFKLSVKIGPNTTPNNTLTNFVEREFTVMPSISVDTTLDIVNPSEEFEVFGDVTSNDVFMVVLEIQNKETGAVAFSSTTMDISSDNKYSMGTFSFDESYDMGIYLVKAALLDSTFNVAATAEKEIEYIEQIMEDYYVTITYEDIDTDRIIGYYKELIEDGSTTTFEPEKFTNYSLLQILVDGQPIEGDNVDLVITNPTEIVCQYERVDGDTGVYSTTFEWVNLSTGNIDKVKTYEDNSYPGALCLSYVYGYDPEYECVDVWVNGVQENLEQIGGLDYIHAAVSFRVNENKFNFITWKFALAQQSRQSLLSEIPLIGEGTIIVQ